MTARNTNSYAPGGARLAFATREQNLAVFDKMTSRVRDLLNYAPINMNVTDLAGRKEADIERAYWRTFKRMAPGWHPFGSDPIP